MATAISPNPAMRIIDYRKASLELAAVVGGLLAAAAGVCAASGHTSLLPVAATSGALCLGVALLCLLITWAKSQSGLITLIRAVMVSQFIRIVLGTLVFVLLVAVFRFNFVQSFAWLLGWYWLLLIVEVWQLKRFVAQSTTGAAAVAATENSSP